MHKCQPSGRDRLVLVVVALLTGVLVMGQICNGSVTPGVVTPTATQHAVVTPESRVRRNLARAWAGPGSVGSPPELTDNKWHELPAGGLVSTDSSGEAWLDIKECETVYIFQDSELIASPCSKLDLGKAYCSYTGATGFNHCLSKVKVQTPSADVEPAGTWFAVIYLPERQLTLVIVPEGEVWVRPVLEFDTRGLGKRVLVGEQQFLYTAPDAVLEQIGELRPRTALPLDQLLPLIRELEIEPWIDRIKPRARADDVPFPDFPPLKVFLQGGGSGFENELVQEAILRAAPWTDLTAELFPGQDVPVIALLPGLEVDTRDVDFDPDVARKLLDEAGFGEGLGLALLFAPDDEPLAAMAELMAEHLNEVGIEVKPGPMPAAEALDVMREIVLSGGAVLWLGHELLDVDLSPPAPTRDETPPTLSRPDIAPAKPTTEDRVRIAVGARDTESGLDRIEIYVNKRLVQRCTTARCVAVVGPYPAGTVTYQVRAYDQAGNRAVQKGTFSVSAVGQPDLVVTALDTTGPAAVNREGNIEMPIRVVVGNQGGADADVFKVATEYTGPRGTFGVAFTVPGQDDVWYPRTRAPLAAGSSVAFAGKVTFLSSEQGATVSLTAMADSCAGDEFMPDYCRVEESDEDNNESKSLTVSLGGEVSLFGSGGPLKDARVQEATLRAVPWPALTKELFPDQDVPISVELPELRGDARDVKHDPDLARELLAEAGFPDGFGLLLLFSPDDEPLPDMAEWMVGSLSDIGIDVRLVEAPPDEAPDMLRELMAAGEAVLWLSRR